MSEKARAVVFAGPHQPLRLSHLDVPTPQHDEVLVRIVACTLCGSDVHSFEGRRTVPTPTVLGHEILGTIEAFGPTAARQDIAGRELHIGDRVTWSIVARCGQCFYCQRGLPQKCARMVKYGHEVFSPGRELTGGLATHCLLVSGTAIVRVPSQLTNEVACPANCATATVAAALEAAGEIQDRTVLVLGAGMLGLTACAMARTRGAAAVLVCDTNAARRERALAFDATHLASADELREVALAVTAGFGVDVVLELTGAPAALENSWPLVRTGGAMVLVGSVFPSRPMPILLEQVVRRVLTIRGVHNYAPQHLQQAIDFLGTATHYPFAALMSQWLPLAEAQRAFEAAQQGDTFRVGITSQ